MPRLDALHPGDRIHRLFRKLHADRWHETAARTACRRAEASAHGKATACAEPDWWWRAFQHRRGRKRCLSSHPDLSIPTFVVIISAAITMGVALVLFLFPRRG